MQAASRWTTCGWYYCCCYCLSRYFNCHWHKFRINWHSCYRNIVENTDTSWIQYSNVTQKRDRWKVNLTTTTSTTTVLWPFVRDCPNKGPTLYQKKHSHTHLSSSSSNLYHLFHLLWSIASFLFSLRAWQSSCTTSVQVLWSTSWSGALHLILHTFHYPISVFFLQHMPIPLQPVLL